MKYVQRDYDGSIKGIFASPQPQEDGFDLCDKDPLEDDDPEIIAYLEKHPPPKMPRATPADFKNAMEDFKRNEEESTRLRKLLATHHDTWAYLESSMSALLGAILNKQSPDHNVPHAIYFSLGGFESRTSMVSGALGQFLKDRAKADAAAIKSLEVIADAWSAVNQELSRLRRTRNIIAHGQIIDLPHGGRRHIRLTSPFLDPKVINLLNDGSLPGLGASEIEAGLTRLRTVTFAIERINDSVSDYLRVGSVSFTRTLPRLEKSVNAFVKSRP